LTDPADSRRKRIIVVVAVARNGVIGDGLRMPWRLPSDLRRFRRLTMGNAIVMGRRTFESIGKPLDGRLNIVVSRSDPEVPEGVRVAKNLDAAVALAEAAPGIADVMIIGGGEPYRAAIGRADLLYVTHVAAEPAGDVTFPPIDPAIWKATRRESPAADPRDTAATEFVIYERVTPL
jgi:dihydrofolate reductase